MLFGTWERLGLLIGGLILAYLLVKPFRNQ